MAINLAQSSAAAKAQQHRRRMFFRVLITMTLLLVATVGATIGLRLYNDALAQRAQTLDEQIARLAATLGGSARATAVAAAVRRATVLTRYAVPGENTPVALMEAVRANLLDAVTVRTVTLHPQADGTSATIEMSTTDLLTAAHQAMRLRADERFRTATLTEVQRDRDGGAILFTVTVTVPTPLQLHAAKRSDDAA